MAWEQYQIKLNQPVDPGDIIFRKGLTQVYGE